MDFTTTDVGLLLVLLFKSFAQYVIVDNRHGPMTAAFQKCRNISRGTLISVDQLHQFEIKIREKCGNILLEEYWIGDYSVMSPFMYMAGCFSFKSLNGGQMMFNITGNSIAKCQARCQNEVGIAIMNDTCQCVKKEASLSSLVPIEAQQCDIRENEEVLGGRQSAMIVYKKANEDASTDGVNPFCFFGKCDGGRYSTFSPCSDMTEAKVVCTNNAGGYANASSWWEAMEQCISSNNSSYLLSPEQFENKTNLLCMTNDNSLTWTTQREYRDQITIPDNGIKENFIFSPSISCQTVNMANLSQKETSDCNDLKKENHGYLCYLDKEISVSSPVSNGTRCIVDLTLLSTPMPSTTEDRSTSERGNPVDKSSEGFSQGAVIGAAIGSGGAIVIVILAIVLCVIRRLRKTEKEKEVPSLETNSPKQIESGDDATSKDDNYDILHNRKHRNSQDMEKENTYAHAKMVDGHKMENTYDSASHLISSKRDSTYDTCTKGHVDETNPTYDHAVRNNRGGTPTLTENIYDKNEPNTYDTSESVVYNKSGFVIYDKGDSDLYDKSGSDIYDKTGHHNKDSGDGSMYDTSDVYTKIQSGKPDCQKENDNPTYDHA